MRSSHACAIKMHPTDVFVYTRYLQCSTVYEYRLARQAIWVVHVILTDSNECGCVTVQDIFEGGVNFLQLKRALVCGGNSRAGSAIFWCTLYDTVCSWPVVQCKKDQWVVVKQSLWESGFQQNRTWNNWCSLWLWMVDTMFRNWCIMPSYQWIRRK